MKRILAVIFNLFLLLLPTLVWAAVGEKIPDYSTHKVNLQGLGGLNYFFAHWYNDSKMIFAIIVTLVMGAIGVAIAAVTDVFLKAIGMDVSKMEHHE